MATVQAVVSVQTVSTVRSLFALAISLNVAIRQRAIQLESIVWIPRRGVRLDYWHAAETFALRVPILLKR